MWFWFSIKYVQFNSIQWLDLWLQHDKKQCHKKSKTVWQNSQNSFGCFIVAVLAKTTETKSYDFVARNVLGSLSYHSACAKYSWVKLLHPVGSCAGSLDIVSWNHDGLVMSCPIIHSKKSKCSGVILVNPEKMLTSNDCSSAINRLYAPRWCRSLSICFIQMLPFCNVCTLQSSQWQALLHKQLLTAASRCLSLISLHVD